MINILETIKIWQRKYKYLNKTLYKKIRKKKPVFKVDKKLLNPIKDWEEKPTYWLMKIFLTLAKNWEEKSNNK